MKKHEVKVTYEGTNGKAETASFYVVAGNLEYESVLETAGRVLRHKAWIVRDVVLELEGKEV